jgi:hypothetical protein
MTKNNLITKIVWVVIFGIAMAFFESAVVVYLRAIFYPEGFKFPLEAMADYKIFIEVMREIASIFMLLSIAYLAGKKFWERFAYFMLSFGVWDIFYYVWLKVLLDWPSSVFEWDIIIARSFQKGDDFRPCLISHVLAIAGAVLVLYSFMCDTEATLHQQMPKPYKYELLIIGDILFMAAFLKSYIKTRRDK